ncbi:hypothetical protein DIJ61_30800 [Burkholderia pseudomallei]|nr:hypothetical protein DIJ60_00985 [Burkholderia pseudomallei]TPA00827.1 hypothetical protein DIJ61_30800 [Burkholderia pseudomallei]
MCRRRPIIQRQHIETADIFFEKQQPPPPNHSPTALSRTGNHPQNCIGTVQNPSTTLTSSSLL